MAFAVVASTPVQAGEELGWRGYALPRMADRMGLAAASVVLGVIWAAWHLPLFFLPGANTFGQSFPLYLTQVVAASVALAWLFTNSHGGLLLPMLFHAAINNTKDIVPSASPGATDVFSFHASRLGWIGATLMWIGALAMLAWMVRTERERAERETPST
jgi:membrane protease YdiL (CAAX protease family)